MFTDLVGSWFLEGSGGSGSGVVLVVMVLGMGRERCN